MIIVSAPTPGYTVTSKDWSHVYRRIREACGIGDAGYGDAGYVVHEAAEWHPYRERWYFFPRKTSTEPFHERTDEREKGNNLLIEADADFDHIEVRPVGDRIPERGPSSIKKKSVKIGGRTESWIGAADLAGNLPAEEEKLGDFKCEGIEIA